jgi:hypothetical protein
VRGLPACIALSVFQRVPLKLTTAFESRALPGVVRDHEEETAAGLNTFGVVGM